MDLNGGAVQIHAVLLLIRKVLELASTTPVTALFGL
jgi:hypothetical protein